MNDYETYNLGDTLLQSGQQAPSSLYRLQDLWKLKCGKGQCYCCPNMVCWNSHR